MDYIESRKIISPEQEAFREDRSCASAVTHLLLCAEDAHSHKKDIVLCYLDLKGHSPLHTRNNWSGLLYY